MATRSADQVPGVREVGGAGEKGDKPGLGDTLQPRCVHGVQTVWGRELFSQKLLPLLRGSDSAGTPVGSHGHGAGLAWIPVGLDRKWLEETPNSLPCPLFLRRGERARVILCGSLAACRDSDGTRVPKF